MKHISFRLICSLLVVALAAAFWSCSPKKNNAATRKYQAFITRYNIYFNGDEHYKETLKEMEKNYEDDYTTTLFLHPAEARANPKAPQPSGNFTRSIEKAQKAIQLRSIKKRPKRKSGKGNDPEYKKWLKRDEYNPFLHNAWMMMGRSQYMDGDFLGAASTFYYTARHFSWLPQTVLEAQLWQARSYCALDWLFEAETILRRVKTGELTTKKLKDLYYFTYADYYVRTHDNPKAIEMLTEAIKYASGEQKTRLTFLLGQIKTLAGDKQGAYEAFKKVSGSSSAPYRTRFNARIKQSEVYDGQNVEPEVKALKRMTRYGSNKEYLDQIYYAIGNLYLSRRDTANAIANYILAADKSTRNGIDKAISQVTLGGLYYDQGRYDLAQPRYSEGMPQLPESYPDYARMKRRSDVLDELAVYTQNVVLNDSLLRLAAMPEEQQLEVINKIIEELKKKEKEQAEEAAREEYMAQVEAAGSRLNASSNANAPTQFQVNTDKSWYFYNTATRNAGRTDFQKRWGSRKLENDWRRRNKSNFSMSATTEEDEETDTAEENSGEETDTAETKEDKEARERENDPHYPEYYIKQIPKTEAEKTVAADVIQEGLYNSGLILKDKLEDFEAAGSEWDRLMDRYPENVYRLDVYYNRYLMNMRRNRPREAEVYRNLIIKEFPESKYAVAMRDPAYLDKLRSMEARQEALYEQAYDDYLNDRNLAVHEAYRTMERDYPLSPVMPKFMFLHALAYVTENNSEAFGNTISDLLTRYPNADIAPLASEWLKGVKAGRKLHSGGSNARGMLWDIRLSNDSTLTAGDSNIEFTLAPEEPHYLVLLFSTDTVSPNMLLYEVARHNFSTYVVKDFDLETMNFGPLGLLIIKGFANQAELNHYRSLLARDGTFSMPGEVRPVEISRSNFEKLLQGAGSFDDYFRFTGEEAIRAGDAVVDGALDAQEIEEVDIPLEQTSPGSQSEAETNPEPQDTPATGEETVEAGEESLEILPTDPIAPIVPTPPPASVVNMPPSLPDYPIGSEGDEED